MTKLTVRCVNPQQAHSAMMQQVWPLLKSMTMAGSRMILELKPETRSGAENRLLHALIGEIAAQKEWAGAKRDSEVWKRLLVAAWCRTRGESVEVLPALDGHGIDMVPARTSKLTRSECAELIEYVYAWGAMNGIRYTETNDPDGRG